jgi:hypothetical protein
VGILSDIFYSKITLQAIITDNLKSAVIKSDR